MRHCKWMLGLLVFVLVGLLVASTAWLVYQKRASEAVEAVIADLKARGTVRKIADFDADKPRNEENAAPLLEEAIALAESIGLVDPMWSGVEWEPSDVPDVVRKQIPLYAPIYELLYRAVERPRCRFDGGWWVQGDFDGITVVDLRDVAKKLTARPMVRAEGGDVNGALEDLRVLFRLSRALREEATLGLFGQLVRIEVADYLLDAFQLILPRCPSPVEAFERVSPDAALGAIAFGLEAELAGALWIAVNTEDFFASLEGVDGYLGAPSRLSIPRHKLDAARLVGELGSHVEIARKPYPAAVELAEAAQARGKSVLLGRDGRITTRTMRTIPPIEQEARHASRVALVKVGAKCLEYRREHGRYPASLGDLPDVSLDPLTERPFILEVLEDGIRLRSEKSEREEKRRAIEWALKE